MQISLLEIATVTLAAILIPQNDGATAQWLAETVPLPEAVSEVRQTSGGVYAKAGDWYELSSCALAPICAESSEPAAPEVPKDGIPDGLVATAAEGNGIRRAWYSSPTDRYAHGALGNFIEGGSLVAEDVFGKLYVATLDPSQVFEDLTPRIADTERVNDYETTGVGI